MTPAQFKAARQALGLTLKGLAERLRLDARTVRRYEQAPDQKGHRPIPGPVEVCMEYFMRDLNKSTKGTSSRHQ